jgi:hypothetical protein
LEKERKMIFREVIGQIKKARAEDQLTVAIDIIKELLGGDEEFDYLLAGIYGLSEKETMIVSLMLRQNGRITTYDKIRAVCWGEYVWIENTNIASHIKRIRQKTNIKIRTFTSIGYMIEREERDRVLVEVEKMREVDDGQIQKSQKS